MDQCPGNLRNALHLSCRHLMVQIVNFVENGAVISTLTSESNILIRHNIDLSEVRGGFSGFTDRSFFSCPCISMRAKSQSFARLRDLNSGNPIGWFIPSLYFSEPDQFYDQKFLADFAYASFMHFWISENYSFVRHSNLSNVTSDKSFTDIVPDEMGFIVISKEAIKKARIRLSDLKISLLRQAVWVLTDKDYFHGYEQVASRVLSIENSLLNEGVEKNNLKTFRLSLACSDVEELIVSILSMAHKEIFGVGGFLYLYQLAEHLMEVNFSERVKQISNESLPAWKVKKKLNEATSEAFRLREIARRATENGAHALIFDALGVACHAFIKSCAPGESDEVKNWMDEVYAVRNILVHNHLSVLRAKASADLEKINILLHRAMLELLFEY